MSENSTNVRGRVLVVDDEASIRDSLRMILEYEGYAVREARSGEEALWKVREEMPDALLLDIKMPEMDGLEVLRSLREQGHDLPIIMITGHGDVASAVEATRSGAYDFFEKPLQRERILLSLRNAVEAAILRRDSGGGRHDPDDMIGTSAPMRSLRRRIEKAAPTPATVLITGESGTGKELVARAIHRLSTRSERPLVEVNCAAIPDELIESELFGHEKGSFTGAVRRQAGKFVVADGATLFLDEVADMSARTQAKVLRVLQNGEVEPVGSARVVRVDVRVVAATNKNLVEEVRAGRFREDLFYRLNVIPVSTPPLRERLEDLPELIDYFVRRYARTHNYRPRPFDDKAMQRLSSLPWRGNVRELKNVVERLLILVTGDEISVTDVEAAVGSGGPEVAVNLLAAKTLREAREGVERLFLAHKLDENQWNVTRTAKAIETPRSNLYKKMEQYGIQRQAIEKEI